MRIFQKLGKKTKEILIKDIGNIVVGGTFKIIAKNDEDKPYIKLDEPFTDYDQEIVKVLFFDYRSIIVEGDESIRMKTLDYLKDRLKLIRYEKIEESRALTMSKYEKDSSLDNGLIETINEYFDNIREIFVVP